MSFVACLEERPTEEAVSLMMRGNYSIVGAFLFSH